VFTVSQYCIYAGKLKATDTLAGVFSGNVYCSHVKYTYTKILCDYKVKYTLNMFHNVLLYSQAKDVEIQTLSA